MKTEMEQCHDVIINILEEVFQNHNEKVCSQEYYNGFSDFCESARSKINLHFDLVKLQSSRSYHKCKTCGKDFFMSGDEVKWLEDKGLKPFTHCYDCRKERRKLNA